MLLSLCTYHTDHYCIVLSFLSFLYQFWLISAGNQNIYTVYTVYQTDRTTDTFCKQDDFFTSESSLVLLKMLPIKAQNSYLFSYIFHICVPPWSSLPTSSQSPIVILAVFHLYCFLCICLWLYICFVRCPWEPWKAPLNKCIIIIIIYYI